MNTIEEIKHRAESDAKTNGCFLNPDHDFLNDLLEGLKSNMERYGYGSCPCRLASGTFEFDRDILCPCDYRDPDVEEFGACYCALYVRKDVYEGKTLLQPVIERRPSAIIARAYGKPLATSTTTLQPAGSTATSTTAVAEGAAKTASGVKLRLWYCKQCGYVVYREDPPYICPICKARREIFAKLEIYTDIRA